MSSWKVWLNTSSKENREQIGKNVWYDGLQENIWKTESIIVIGNARIYNESSLWEMMERTKKIGNSPMEIIVELYKIYGFETMLEYLDGDYAFVLMDYNIFGEESRLFVAKDTFGIFPLYKIEYPDTSYKKVSFVPSERNPVSEFVATASISEMKASPLYIEIPTSPYGKPHSNIYGFSSESLDFEDASLELVPNGTCQFFTHSYKVSANWKPDGNMKLIYQLPFQSTYGWKKHEFRPPNIQNRLEEQIRIAVQKRVEWMLEYQDQGTVGTVGFLKLSIGGGLLPSISLDSFLNIQVVEIKLQLFSSCDDISLSLEEEYLETKYPSLLQEIKTKIKSNNPGIIRAHFIPTLVAKTIVENYPEVKTVWMGEAFTYEYLEMNMFERRKWIKNVYFLEKVRAWTETFLLYGLEIYMPFLDRMLVQSPDQYSRV